VELWQLGVAELAVQVRARAIHPSEVIESCLARITELDPEVQAWVTVTDTVARARSASLAERLAAGRDTGTLAGVPLGLKDNIFTAGVPTTASSQVLADFVPEQDAAVVLSIHRADAFMLGKTRTSEFAASDPAPTRNPWHLGHTPGGSSSGSASAVAAGMVPAALGTQTGGSVIRPAAFTGIVGFKPSYGAVPTEGTIPLSWTFDHVGVLARSVVDTTLVFEAIGHSPSASSPAIRPSRTPRLGVYVPVSPSPDPEVRSSFDLAVGRLSEAGVITEEVRPPDGSYERLLAGYLTILRSEAATYHRAQFAKRAQDYRPLITQIIELGLEVPAVDYVQAMQDRREISGAWKAMLSGLDAVIAPSTCGPAPLGIADTGDPSYQIPWSYTGSPAISLPYGCTRDGLPLGLQVIGHPGADTDLLRLAGRLEETLAFTSHPPSWNRGATS
jgi:aspartyl-tRNA(Asn)/glutamyl-tRNA(Gln) amidotransferase subunit A